MTVLLAELSLPSASDLDAGEILNGRRYPRTKKPGRQLVNAEVLGDRPRQTPPMEIQKEAA